MGVPDHRPDIALTVRPNPTAGTVRIDSDRPLSRILLTDLQGRELQDVPVFGESTLQLDLTPYPVGIYFVTATTCEGTTRVMKVAKK